MQYSQNPPNVPPNQPPGSVQYGQPPQQPVTTTMRDVDYDMVSVLYHALKGAQACATYIQDAGREGNQELTQFFTQIQREEIALADKTRQMLNRMSQQARH
jgi:hypothetical protein